MKFLFFIVLTIGVLFGSVDINNASVKELSVLKGVGSKKAQKIIEYRKIHCFKKTDDILKIKGFGDKFLKNNRKELIVGKCKK